MLSEIYINAMKIQNGNISQAKNRDAHALRTKNTSSWAKRSFLQFLWVTADVGKDVVSLFGIIA